MARARLGSPLNGVPHLGTPPTPVREALARLELGGLVVKRLSAKHPCETPGEREIRHPCGSGAGSRLPDSYRKWVCRAVGQPREALTVHFWLAAPVQVHICSRVPVAELPPVASRHLSACGFTMSRAAGTAHC